MAKPNPELVNIIRRTANKLEKGAPYQWGHMGSCNCGHLAQEITKLSRADIHEYATRQYGDWTTQSNHYCPTSGYPMDLLISKMLKVGLNVEDIKNLERLTDQQVLQTLPPHLRDLSYNVREDVVLYMKAWADLLEKKLPQPQKVTKKVSTAVA
jgi:hypothetical protein